MTTQLAEKAEVYLHRLCVDITARHTGSAGNRAATELFVTTVAGWPKWRGRCTICCNTCPKFSRTRA